MKHDMKQKHTETDRTFPENFLWGTATASYQVEGAVSEGGRKPSIWDTFCTVPGKVRDGQSGAVACDQYHRYEEDIAVMKELGIKAYRFSIAWPRIIPDGTGAVNAEGVAFYHRLIDALLQNNIEPVVTLYHWDLPQTLQDRGGWTNRETASVFAEYAAVCFAEFGSKVKRWITLNEPFCSSMLGYYFGVHAPGHTSLDETLQAVHHLNLAHGLAVQAFRSESTKRTDSSGGSEQSGGSESSGRSKSGLGEIGITFNPSYPRAASQSAEDLHAAATAKAWESDIFTHPVFGKGYPSIVTDELGCTFPVKDGDMEIIAEPIDFYGVNYYTEQIVTADAAQPQGYRALPMWQPRTEMGWAIVSAGLKRLLHIVNEDAGGLPVYVTENGIACDDSVSSDGRVHDAKRIDYLEQHFTACQEAIAEGVPLKGYFLWSLLDNFEWAFGYSKRFGIVHVDFSGDLQRTIKDSGYFYRDVIAGLRD